MKKTALHKAAHRGYKDIVQLLVEEGALIEAMDNDNATSLHLAARNGHTRTVELPPTLHTVPQLKLEV